MKVLDRLRVTLFGTGAIGILPLRPASAPEVARLQAEGGFARDWSAAECEALLADCAVQADGLFAGGRMAGVILSRYAVDEAEVLTIVMARRLRGQGLAARLLAAHVTGLSRRGVRRLLLEVDAANEPAIALYRRAGFATVGERRGYYPRPDGTRANALVMAFEFDQAGRAG
jgi:[ribosomal protein S18]-alanine N-acetyltransferase